ncbi:MAG: hypothetical protein IJM02_07090 [Clostridia bacterium]|nr:hypothetical protein [Clostridia bacterium]
MKNVSPVIILPGINHSPVYLYDENDNPVTDESGKKTGGTLMIPDTAAFKEKLPALAKALAASIVTRKADGIYEKAYDCAAAVSRIQQCDSDGDFINNLKPERWYYPVSEMDDELKGWAYRMVPMQALTKEIGEDKLFFFTFNLVGDPLDSAKELQEYIKFVKEYSGSEKVSFLPVSLGGTILTAYLSLYEADDIDRIVNVVACLDGTDIVGDIFARDFDTSDLFLRHEFIPAIFREETGDALPGYGINILLHTIPDSAFSAFLSGFMSGILDTLMLNCPQIWAMLPSYRYDGLRERYLTGDEHARLRERTDAFQKARLTLKDSLLKAAESGVKIDYIAGSGLDFGDVEYCYFAAVKSKSRYNTDGIINLSSCTLGAHGAPRGKTLPASYISEREREGKGEYISPDRRVDVSTALMPDNTWVFLNQHHEVGKNNAVLNLAKSIITGEVENVHSDPVNYPQFNRGANTYVLRRWKSGDGARVLEEIRDGSLRTAPSVKAQLEKAVSESEQVLGATVGDAHRASKALKDIEKILVRLGKAPEPQSQSEIRKLLCKTAEGLSRIMIRRK